MHFFSWHLEESLPLVKFYFLQIIPCPPCLSRRRNIHHGTQQGLNCGQPGSWCHRNISHTCEQRRYYHCASRWSSTGDHQWSSASKLRRVCSPTRPRWYPLITFHRHKEVMPAPGVTSTTTTSPPLEKTAWQTATQAPAPQPGQGLIAQRSVDLNQLGEEPRLVNCPFCHHQAMTRVQKESTSATG